jgi:ferritin-like metal-binding protein YciE
MGLFSKEIKTMNDLFVHTLRNIYYAENQITKLLPDMIKKATHPQIKEAFTADLGETENHIERLEDVLRMYRVEVEGIECPAIDGIIDESNNIVSEVADNAVLDAALVAVAQAVEHYEITRYDTLIAWAEQLGGSDCASVLQRNLEEEEKAADKTLTSIANGAINTRATATASACQ